jgi:hypothetical protein
MGTATVIGVLVALLVLLGGMLYLAAQFILRKMQSADSKFAERKRRLWIWRSFILVLLAYSIFLLFANMEFFNTLFFGPLKVFFMIFVVIYFVALIELVVIDMLLPDVVSMWKRIAIELVVFVLLCGLTVVTFNVSMIALSGSV